MGWLEAVPTSVTLVLLSMIKARIDHSAHRAALVELIEERLTELLDAAEL